MARVDLSVQHITYSGITPSYTSASADGNAFVNDGGVFVHVRNDGAQAVTLTIPTPAQVDGLDIADVVVTINASSESMVGVFNPTLFNQPDGKVHLDWSAVTGVTVAALKT